MLTYGPGSTHGGGPQSPSKLLHFQRYDQSYKKAVANFPCGKVHYIPNKQNWDKKKTRKVQFVISFDYREAICSVNILHHETDCMRFAGPNMILKTVLQKYSALFNKNLNPILFLCIFYY